MTEAEARYQRICWQGDWRELPRHCGGNVEVWDQTVGCPECGMNIWYLPERAQWPAWDAENAPADDHWEQWKAREDKADGPNPYDPYMRLFELIHPFQFFDAHDPGDEDRNAHYDEWSIGP